ncbi:MAG: adenosine deaminase [Opitutaceae bacterium]|jgi:adenosine deaminase CECR1|nr:adenosine deaminase [Opitutaceae bacterium]
MRALFTALIFSCSTLLLTAADFSKQWEEIKTTASPEQLYRFLYALPKGGDLHNHFGGSLIPEWKWDVLTDPARNGGDTFYSREHFAAADDAINPPSRHHTIRQHTFDQLPENVRREYVKLTDMTSAERETWLNAFRLDAPGEGRAVFFDHHWPRLGDIHNNPHVKFELLAENLKAFAAEGIRYMEIQFGLYTMAHNDGTPLWEEEMLALMEARLAEPDVASTGIETRFLEAILRFTPNALQELERSYAWVDSHRDRWVGLNMVGIEESGKGYPLRFLETYRKLRAIYPTLPLSIHAGEMDSPDKNIRETLLLGASRIGHGVNILGDPDTLLMLQHSDRTLIEINLISNRLLEYVPNLDAHPFPELLRTGVPVCLNTDDRGMWDSNMTDEYYTAVDHFDLSWSELTQLARNSLRHAFVDDETKQRLLESYEKDLAAFASRFAGMSTAEALAEIENVNAVAYGYAERTWGFDFERN